jgi:hypothetical protein
MAGTPPADFPVKKSLSIRWGFCFSGLRAPKISPGLNRSSAST